MPLQMLLMAAWLHEVPASAYQYGRSTQHLGKSSCGRDNVVGVLTAGNNPLWTDWHNDWRSSDPDQVPRLLPAWTPPLVPSFPTEYSTIIRKLQ